LEKLFVSKKLSHFYW